MVHGAGVEHKRTSVAYLWWLFFGPVGAHRFYVGHTKAGVLYACTLGLLLMGWLMDLFMIPGYVKCWNHRVDFPVGTREEPGFLGGAGV